MDRLFVVKAGGAVLQDPRKLHVLLRDFSQLEEAKLLVHGGGRKATEIANALGLETQMIHGRRLTDPAMLDVMVMVCAGLANKTIVSRLQALSCNAIGISGADGNLITAAKRPPKNNIDFGLVGDVIRVNANLLTTLIEKQLTPVIAPVTHDGKGQLLNTNADTIAKETACAMTKTHEVHLVYLFEQLGVLTALNNPQSLIAELNAEYYQELKAQRIVHGGMIPKLDNAFATLEKGVFSVRIGSFDRLKDMVNGLTGSHTKLIIGD